MNFNAGPAALPRPALERAQRELLDFAGTGMSVMEHSHRGPEYEAVHDEAIALLRELLHVPADYEVIFLQGGATQQFAQVPMNFLHAGGVADYVVNGVWGEKALAEANVVASLSGGKVHIAASTGVGERPVSYVRAPSQDELILDPGAAYVHVTSNETIHGIQFESLPDFGGVPVVCDMSSDILSRPIDVSRFAFLYAGAQKNIGPSGVVVGVARKAFLAASRKDIPKIFQYREFAAANSLLNTPSTFGIYLVRNVLAWIKETGGLPAMEARNREKASLLYGAIDARPDFYRAPVDRRSRSQMNVVFRLPTAALEERMVQEATARGMVGIKGHRSVGGLRVSLYNAVEIDWVRALVSFMEDFAKASG
jgi:phosphoserine aminotransferase